MVCCYVAGMCCQQDNGHLSELRRKLNGYRSIDEFASDLQQVIAGLLEASVNHSTVHRTAVKMKDQVQTVYSVAMQMLLSLCYNAFTLVGG